MTQNDKFSTATEQQTQKLETYARAIILPNTTSNYIFGWYMNITIDRLRMQTLAT